MKNEKSRLRFKYYKMKIKTLYLCASVFNLKNSKLC